MGTPVAPGVVGRAAALANPGPGSFHRADHDMRSIQTAFLPAGPAAAGASQTFQGSHGQAARLARAPLRVARVRSSRALRSGPSAAQGASAGSGAPEEAQPNSPGMAWVTAVSSEASLTEALADVAAKAIAALPDGATPDLALVYVSSRYSVSKFGPLGRESLEETVPRLRSFIPGLKNIVGCTASGVVGSGPMQNPEEVEDKPAVSLCLAHLPGVKVNTFHVLPEDMPDLDAGQQKWRDLVGDRENDQSATQQANMLLFADPGFASRGQLGTFLEGMDYVYPGNVKVGAVASASGPRSGHLFCTTKRDILMQTSPSLYDAGLVGCILSGDIEIEPILSPGCRSVGPVFEIRRAGPNTICEVEISGKPSVNFSGMGALRYVFERSTSGEQQLIQNDLVVGVARDEFKDTLLESDYVIRQIIGVDPKSGCLGVAQNLRAGQRIQFHVRDREVADTKMKDLMEKYKRKQLSGVLKGNCNPAVGALMLACEGRGVGLFRDRNHDSAMLAKYVNVPIGGFFASAELAPSSVMDSAKTDIHTFTTIFALLKRKYTSLTDESKGATDTSEDVLAKEDEEQE